jgi:hypothetical protein
MWEQPGNIDELLNAQDYVPPVLRGKQIAKLIGQGAASSADLDLAQERIVALEEQLKEDAQHYEDNLVPVFNVGHSAGYKQGHKAGWKEAVGASREYGFKLGYVEAAKDLIGGDNFILIDKNNLANTIKGKTTQKLMGKIPAEDTRYAGLRNDVFRDTNRTGGLIDIYARNSSWISAQDEILFLDIAKTRTNAQKQVPIAGKRIITNQAGNLDWKPATADFPTILKSVLDPGKPQKYKYPDAKQVQRQGEIKYLEFKKGKK